MKPFSVDWAEIKDMVDNRDGLLQVVETPSRYLLQVQKGDLSLQSFLTKEVPAPVGSELEDFIDNYLPSANQLNVRKSEMQGVNPTGDLKTLPVSGCELSNSTSTPLLANQTFTGVYIDCSEYISINILAITDQYSAEDGVRIDFSIDGTDGGIVRTLKTTAIPTPEGAFFSIPCEAKFFRLKYTNGPVDQTTFRLSVQLKTSGASVSTPIGSKITDFSAGTLTRAVEAGKNPDGDYVNRKHTGKITTQSSTTPLLANAEFIGPVTESDGYGSLDFTIISDQPSANNGAKVEWFADENGANLIREVPFTYTSVNEGSYFQIPVQGSHFRIHYINGPTDQATFAIDTRLNEISKTSAIMPLEEPVKGELLGLLTRSVIVGQDPDDGTFGNVGVKDGRIQVESINVPAPLNERFQQFAIDGLGSHELNVNGSLGSPKEFLVNGAAANDRLVDFMSFQAFDNGMKINNFLGQNSELSNGIIVEVKSQDTIFQFIPIKNTTEFNSLFALGPARSFQLMFASGNDSLVATFGPNAPFILKKQGTFATDDYVKIIIRDNLSDVTRLRFSVTGRVKED